MPRVQKLLSNYGYCSRRKAEELIAQGKVTVNGKVIGLGDQADLNDIIMVDGKKIEQQKKVYYLFHKPKGLVTALRDAHEQTIFEILDIKERVIPVGRLDKDASGLLLLTNDGDFANNIMHPRYEIKKTYVVTLDKPYTKQTIQRLEQGIPLRDGKTRPAKIKRRSKTVLEVTIHEGKHHIIKRMFRKMGFFVRDLKRISVGKYSLGKLPEGKYISFKP